MLKIAIALGLATIALSELGSVDDIMQCDKNQNGQLQIQQLQCVGNASGVPIPQWGFAELQAKLGKGKSFQRADVAKGQEKLAALKQQTLKFQTQLKNDFKFNEKIGMPQLTVDASQLKFDLKSTLKGSIGKLQIS